jgi:hypothetical protein
MHQDPSAYACERYSEVIESVRAGSPTSWRSGGPSFRLHVQGATKLSNAAFASSADASFHKLLLSPLFLGIPFSF